MAGLDDDLVLRAVVPEQAGAANPAHAVATDRRLEVAHLLPELCAHVALDLVPAADDDEPLHEVVRERLRLLDCRARLRVSAAAGDERRDQEREDELPGQAAAVCSCLR